MDDCKHDFQDTHLQGHKVCLKCHLTFNPHELQLMARVAELEDRVAQWECSECGWHHEIDCDHKAERDWWHKCAHEWRKRAHEWRDDVHRLAASIDERVTKLESKE
jgi:hypothetical protein